jgi:hypothetical protein
MNGPNVSNPVFTPASPIRCQGSGTGCYGASRAPHREYREAGNSHRFETALMYGQLVVYLTASGFLLNALLHDEPPRFPYDHALPAVGIALSLAFLVLVGRPGKHLGLALNRAICLERQLAFNLYRQRRPARFLKSRNVHLALYLLGCAFWIGAFVLSFSRARSSDAVNEGGILVGICACAQAHTQCAHEATAWKAEQSSGPKQPSAPMHKFDRREGFVVDCSGDRPVYTPWRP